MLFMLFTLHSQLHIKSFKICSIVSFDNFYNYYLDFKYHLSERKLADKIRNSWFLSQYLKNYKLLNDDPNRMLNFHFES